MRHIAGSKAGEENGLKPKYSAVDSEHNDKKAGKTSTCGVAIEEGSEKK